MNANRPNDRRTGVVLPTVLVLMLTISLVVGLLSRFSVRSMRLTRRTLDVRRAFVVAMIRRTSGCCARKSAKLPYVVTSRSFQ